jgi:hypothetical protein
VEHRHLKHSSIQFWKSDAGLSAFLFLLILTTFILPPLSHEWHYGHLLNSIFLSFLLIGGILISSEKFWMMITLTAMIATTLVLHWADTLTHTLTLTALGLLFMVISFALLVAVMGIQIFRDGPITLHRIQGAIATYLLLGLTWASGFTLVALYYPHAFNGAIPSDPLHHMESWIYFSFTTLTTVGYGDITPAHPIARSMAIMEALIGQLFPAILISRLVAQELEEKSKRA